MKLSELYSDHESLPYGYWIRPDGTTIDVPMEKHDDIAVSYGFLHDHSITATMSAMKSGWVRVVLEDNILGIMFMGSLTRRAANTILKIHNNYFRHGVVYVSFGRISIGRIEHEKIFRNEAGLFRQFIKSHIA